MDFEYVCKQKVVNVLYKQDEEKIENILFWHKLRYINDFGIDTI